MTQTTNNNNQTQSWKVQTYILGLVAGVLFGAVSAYMYTRAAEQDMAQHDGERKPVQPVELITIVLAGLTLMRQIAELGRTPQGGRRR